MIIENPNNNQMYYEINKKSLGVAYLLWLLLFCIGGHRFYTKNYVSAIIIIILTVVTMLGWAAAFIAGYFVLVLSSLSFLTLCIWWIADAFLTHTNVNKNNTKLAIKCGLLDSTIIF